jgi:hypothetical protein
MLAGWVSAALRPTISRYAIPRTAEAPALVINIQKKVVVPMIYLDY